MRKLRKTITALTFTIMIAIPAMGCGATYASKAPPPPRHEMRTVRPYPSAAWVSGHWNWNARTRTYIWVDGHWTSAKHGKTWFAGHWKHTPRGWVWVKGSWK